MPNLFTARIHLQFVQVAVHQFKVQLQHLPRACQHCLLLAICSKKDHFANRIMKMTNI